MIVVRVAESVADRIPAVHRCADPVRAAALRAAEDPDQIVRMFCPLGERS